MSTPKVNKIRILSVTTRRKIKARGLAAKYKVTPQYVNAILRGDRKANSKKARSILEDALRMLEIMDEKPR